MIRPLNSVPFRVAVAASPPSGISTKPNPRDCPHSSETTSELVTDPYRASNWRRSSDVVLSREVSNVETFDHDCRTPLVATRPHRIVPNHVRRSGFAHPIPEIGRLIGQPRRSFQTYVHVLNFTLPPGRVEGEVRAFGEGGRRLDRCSNGPPRKFAYAHFRPSRRREGEVLAFHLPLLGFLDATHP